LGGENMLKTKHFFPFIKMIKALEIKEDLKAFYQKVQGKTKEELENLDSLEGFDYLYLFIEKLPNAEKEVMNFLSMFLEKPVNEIEEMALDEMWKVISDLFKDPLFKTFFQSAVK
jgi:hypothetical protein